MGRWADCCFLSPRCWQSRRTNLSGVVVITVDLDLAKAERREVGRPSLAAGVSPRVSFRTTETLYVATRRRAEVEGRTVSDLVREAVERYVYDRALDNQ